MLMTAERHRERVQRFRIKWRPAHPKILPEEFVFITKTWAQSNVAHTRGCAAAGTRVEEDVPTNRWQIQRSFEPCEPLESSHHSP